MNLAQFRSTAVTCLIRPPRVSSLTVVRCRACSSVRSRVVNRSQCLALPSITSRSARSPVRVLPSLEVICLFLSSVRTAPCRNHARLYCGQFLSSIAGRVEDMANTSTRSFRLLSLLQNHRYWAGADLAARLGVSARTLRRDVDRLRELGYPVEAHPGVDGGYQLAAGAALPPLVVDDEEAVALAAGLLLAAQGAAAVPRDAGDGDVDRGGG